jgi:hypothetical protein
MQVLSSKLFEDLTAQNLRHGSKNERMPSLIFVRLHRILLKIDMVYAPAQGAPAEEHCQPGPSVAESPPIYHFAFLVPSMRWPRVAEFAECRYSTASLLVTEAPWSPETGWSLV